jgi:hypothetical protein
VGASFSHHAQGGGIWPGGAGMPNPSRKRRQPTPASEPSKLGEVMQADFVGFTACPRWSLGMPRVSTVPWVQGQGRPPGQAFRRDAP